MTANSRFGRCWGITVAWRTTPFNNTLAKVGLFKIYTTHCASQLTLSGWVTGGPEETQEGYTAMMTELQSLLLCAHIKPEGQCFALRKKTLNNVYTVMDGTV